jgi:hypothetical protein
MYSDFHRLCATHLKYNTVMAYVTVNSGFMLWNRHLQVIITSSKATYLSLNLGC